MEISLLQLAPPTWTRTTLGEIVARGGGSIQTGPFGSQLHASDYVPEGVPSIMPVNIGENRLIRDGIACIRESDAQRLSKHIVRKGDIIYSRRGDVERRAIVRESEDGWFCGTGCLKVRLGHGVIVPEFAAFYLGHPEVRSWIVRHAVGITMPNLNTSIMESVPFLLPPLDEQQAIAETLQSLDDKIEQNRRTGSKLEGLARAVFKAWFVDFEPVKAKAAGATAFPGMPPETFATLPTRFTNSALGPVPEGWEVKPLSEAFEVNPPRRLAKGADAPYLDMKNMPTDSHAPDTWERRAHGSGMKFINGDTLVARITPCLENGKTAYVDFLNEGEVAWGSTEYIVLRPKPPLPPIFAYCLARMEPFRDYAIQNMSGTSGRQRVAASAMEHYHVAVPDVTTSRSFGEVVGPLFDYIRASKAESAKLATLRDYLLPKLLAGQVRVKSEALLP